MLARDGWSTGHDKRSDLCNRKRAERGAYLNTQVPHDFEFVRIKMPSTILEGIRKLQGNTIPENRDCRYI